MSDQSKGYACLVCGIGAFVGILYFMDSQEIKINNYSFSVALLPLISGVMLGSMYIAIGKGFSWFDGFVCGFFARLGLIILMLLPPNKKKVRRNTMSKDSD